MLLTRTGPMASPRADWPDAAWLMQTAPLPGAGLAVARCPALRHSPGTLRILVTWLLLDERARCGVTRAPASSPNAAGALCKVALSMTAAAVRDPGLTPALERLLHQRLEVAATRFRGLCLHALAELWSREKETLRGRSLVALLWTAATHPCPLFHRLEAAIVRRVDASGRWSLLDDADDPFGA